MKKATAIAALVAPLVSGCTWGNYDGDLGSYEAGAGTAVSSGGGIVVSSDYVFEMAFLGGSFTSTALVSITTVSNNGASDAAGSAYNVATSDGTPLSGAAYAVFHLDAGGNYSFPHAQAIVLGESAGTELPGGLLPDGNTLFGVASSLGTYEVVQDTSADSPRYCANTCGSTCIETCCVTALTDPGSCSCDQPSSTSTPPCMSACSIPDCITACVNQGSGCSQ